MTTKDLAKQLIDRLPDEATMDEIMHVLYLRAKFETGERQIREGQGISHDEAKQKLQKWVK